MMILYSPILRILIVQSYLLRMLIVYCLYLRMLIVYCLYLRMLNSNSLILRVLIVYSYILRINLKEGEMGSEPKFIFASSAKVCYVIYLTILSLFLFSFWYCCDNIDHHLGYEPLSAEEFVNHFRKLTNIYSKLFCFHHSTNHHTSLGC